MDGSNTAQAPRKATGRPIIYTGGPSSSQSCPPVALTAEMIRAAAPTSVRDSIRPSSLTATSKAGSPRYSREGEGRG